MTNYIIINNLKFPIKIIIENRKNSRASIGKKAVYIRIPEFMDNREKQLQIDKFKDWAYKKLKGRPKAIRSRYSKQYNDGDILKLDDSEYRLRITYKDK